MCVRLLLSACACLYACVSVCVCVRACMRVVQGDCLPCRWFCQSLPSQKRVGKELRAAQIPVKAPTGKKAYPAPLFSPLLSQACQPRWQQPPGFRALSMHNALEASPLCCLTGPLPPSASLLTPTACTLIKDDTSECPDTHTQKCTNQKVYFLEADSQEKSSWKKLE